MNIENKSKPNSLEEDKIMMYRIEMERINKHKINLGYDNITESAHGAKEVQTYLNECVPDGFKVTKIIKTTKDGRGCDVTDKYIK